MLPLLKQIGNLSRIRNKGVTVADWKAEVVNVVKGFGFIVPDDGGADVYIPMSKVGEAKLPHLETRMALRYSIGEGKGREILSVIEGTKVVFALKSVSAQPSFARNRCPQ